MRQIHVFKSSIPSRFIAAVELAESVTIVTHNWHGFLFNGAVELASSPAHTFSELSTLMNRVESMCCVTCLVFSFGFSGVKLNPSCTYKSKYYNQKVKVVTQTLKLSFQNSMFMENKAYF